MNLELYSVCELSDNESVETEGGILPLLILAAGALLLSSCGNQSNTSNGRSKQISVQCSNCNVTIHNDTVKVYHK